MADKHDVFVGNLTYNCTEDQLHQIFSTVGTINEVRMVMDRQTNKPKGYAFIEYGDAATALSAIRNLDGTELNNRKLRVSYTNNSNLKELALQGKIEGAPAVPGYVIPENLTTHLPLHEAYDILSKMKDLLSEDRGHRAKELLEAYPQLIPAFSEILTRLGLPKGKF